MEGEGGREEGREKGRRRRRRRRRRWVWVSCCLRIEEGIVWEEAGGIQCLRLKGECD